jgi:hypothetical protein
MASVRGLLNIQSLNELTYEKPARERHACRGNSRGLARGERRDGRVCPPGHPGSVAGVRASSLANARRSRVRVTPRALAVRAPVRARTALREGRSACAPPRLPPRRRLCGVRFDLRSGSSKLSCDAKYNRNWCGGGRACGGAYWN